MYLQNDAEMAEIYLVMFTCLACFNFYKVKSMNDLRRKMDIINKINMVDNNILSSISTQIFNAGVDVDLI